PLSRPCAAVFSVLCPPPLCAPLFPYTTLFRSLLTGNRTDGPQRVNVQPSGVLQVFRAVPLCHGGGVGTLGPAQGLIEPVAQAGADRKSTRLNSSHVSISYAVFCLKKKNATRMP